MFEAPWVGHHPAGCHGLSLLMWLLAALLMWLVAARVNWLGTCCLGSCCHTCLISCRHMTPPGAAAVICLLGSAEQLDGLEQGALGG
jgi:hypothetical protein